MRTGGREGGGEGGGSEGGDGEGGGDCGGEGGTCWITIMVLAARCRAGRRWAED